jgi:hypothetical protein
VRGDETLLTQIRRHRVAWSVGIAGALAFGYIFQLTFQGVGWQAMGANAQHLAFRTSEVTAVVTDRERAGLCGHGRSRNPQPSYLLTLHWTPGTGEQRTTTFRDRNCRHPVERGTSVSAWTTDDGRIVRLDSPWQVHLGAWMLLLLVAAVLTGYELIIRLVIGGQRLLDRRRRDAGGRDQP